MTRRDFLAEAEKYEAILTSQREAGIDRSPDDVFGNKYRTFESIPDFIIYAAWESITNNYDAPAPSRSRMLKDIEKETDESGCLLDDPDTYWWETAGTTFEEQVERAQKTLSENWGSLSHKDKAGTQDFLHHFQDNPRALNHIAQLAEQHKIDSAHALKTLYELNKDAYTALQKVEQQEDQPIEQKEDDKAD